MPIEAMTTNTGPAILRRLLESDSEDLSPEAARFILKLDFPKKDHARVRDLSAKANEGTLSGDGRRIDWSNGTYWTRCSGGGGHHTPNLDGTWYRGGDRSQRCNIRQRKNSIQLRNESGQAATGSIDRRGRVTTNWSGTQITGTLSSDGNTINWDNGTSWSR